MYQNSPSSQPNMSLEEFETQSRETIEQTLNHLHTASLLAGQLETQITETGRSLQTLSQLIEAFIAQQRRQSS
jgi:hypothetical protein